MNWYRRIRDEYLSLADGFPREWRSLLCWAVVLPDGEMIGEEAIVRLEFNEWQVI